MRRRHQMVQGCGVSRTALAEPICPSPTGARGGLDARLGDSLDLRSGVNSRIHHE
jgi:hypothetical protein